jgi:hypothetical protein
MDFVFIYNAYWCPTRFPYQMILVSVTNNGEGTVNTSGAPEFTSYV